MRCSSAGSESSAASASPVSRRRSARLPLSAIPAGSYRWAVDAPVIALLAPPSARCPCRTPAAASVRGNVLDGFGGAERRNQAAEERANARLGDAMHEQPVEPAPHRSERWFVSPRRVSWVRFASRGATSRSALSTGKSPGAAVAVQVSGTTVTSSLVSGSPTSTLTVLPSIGRALSGPIRIRNASPSPIAAAARGVSQSPSRARMRWHTRSADTGTYAKSCKSIVFMAMTVASSWSRRHLAAKGIRSRIPWADGRTGDTLLEC